MIAYIEGRLAERTDTSAVVITDGGVGYEVYLPAHTLTTLPERGGLVQYYLSHIVREDCQELFGFATWDERQMFELLITLNKVGARTANAILSQFRPGDLRRIVIEDDPTPLTLVPGIGKKTAQQIFLELQYKLKIDASSFAGLASKGSSTVNTDTAVFKDVVAGLVGLQYSENDAAVATREVLKQNPGITVADAIRAALKLLMRK